MKKLILLLLAVLVFSFAGCEDNPVEDILNTKVTAKKNVDAVKTKSKTDFSSDAQMSGIIGRNVSIDGTIDLIDFTSVKGFIYMMQSESKGSEQFYMPVFASDPVKLPFTLSDLLSLIDDPDSRERMEDVFALLSTVSISESAEYPDSDEAMERFLKAGGQDYVSANTNAKVDLFLVPSTTITLNGLQSSADWVCNFYGGNTSLTLWLNSGTGIVTTF